MMASVSRDWSDGFLLAGNHPALHLLNTDLVRDGAPIEFLSDAQAMERWLIASSLVMIPKLKSLLRGWGETDEAGTFLKELLAFRDHLRLAVIKLEGGKLPSANFIDELNALLYAHPVRPAIVVKGRQLEQVQVVGTSMTDTLWALLASQTLKLFTEAPPSRIRKCESCVVHFLDTSKKGSRRWCSMDLCGNRVKVAAYKQRQSTQEARD